MTLCGAERCAKTRITHNESEMSQGRTPDRSAAFTPVWQKLRRLFLPLLLQLLALAPVAQLLELSLSLKAASPLNMPRESPRPESKGNAEDGPSRYRDDRRDRYSRKDDDYRSSRHERDGGYGRGRNGGESSRKYEDRDRRDRNGGRDRRQGDDGGERDRARDRDRYRDGDRGYGRERGREDDRRRDRDDDRRQGPGDKDRDSQRAGPSRRSASPRQRSSKPDSRSRSRSAAAEDKAKPNFAPSGLLAAATKTVQHGDGTKTVLKYHEPPEARKPSGGWRLYVFKEKEQVGEFVSHCMKSVCSI